MMCWKLKGLRYLLLKNEKKLTQKKTERLQKAAENHPSLYRLWQLRQELLVFYL